MKIICISDTHCLHNHIDDDVKSIEADVIIHAGDRSNSKVTAVNDHQLRDCLTWLTSLTNVKHKIFVPGNHDVSLFHGLIKANDYPEIIFLINKEIIIDDVKFYGSPVTPTFGVNWAWNCKRGKIDKYWQRIPEDTNVLITHGPPYGINDNTRDYGNKIEQVGCKNLLNRVLDIQPDYHIFGHLHDEVGIFNNGVRTLGEKCKTTFVNPSIVNLKHQVVNKPIVLE